MGMNIDTQYLREQIEGMKDETGPTDYTGPYNAALDAVLELLTDHSH